MLGRLRDLLQASSPSEQIKTDDEARPLAAAALLFHAASLDGSVDASEERVIASLIEERFGLSGDDAAALLEDARQAEEDASQILHFTRDIKDNSSHEDRIALLEMLWEVVFADGEEHAFESNLMRRVSGLLYVTDQESGAARRRVRDRLGLT